MEDFRIQVGVNVDPNAGNTIQKNFNSIKNLNISIDKIELSTIAMQSIQTGLSKINPSISVNIDPGSIKTMAIRSGQVIGTSFSQAMHSAIQKGDFPKSFGSQDLKNAATEAEKYFKTISASASVMEHMGKSDGLKSFIVECRNAEGIVEKLNYQLDNKTKMFEYAGGSINNNGVIKQFESINRAIADYESKIEKFKSTNNGILSGLSQPLTDFESKLNVLKSGKGNINDVKNAFAQLNAESARISSNLINPAQSFNKVQTALNNIKNGEQTIRQLNADFDSLKDKPDSVAKGLREVENLLKSVKSIESTSGRNQDWGTAYKEYINALTSVKKEVSTLSKEQKVDTSEVVRAKELYKEQEISLNKILGLKAQIAFTNETKNPNTVSTLQQQLSLEQERYRTIDKELGQFSSIISNEERRTALTLNSRDAVEKLQQAQAKASDTTVQASEKQSATTQKLENDLKKAESNLQSIGVKWSALFSDKNLSVEFDRLSRSLGNIKNPAELKQWNAELSVFKNNVKSSSMDTTSFTETLKSNAKKFLEWITVGNMTMTVWRSFQKGFEFVKTLDTALTTIHMTMNVNKQELKELGDAAIKMGEDYGTSADKVLKAVAIYANMNETTESILNKALPTVLLSNASSMDTSTTSDIIQGTLSQFEMAEDQALHISDVFQNVSANIAVDFQKGIYEMAQAIQVSGSVAHDAGVNFEDYASIVAKVIEKTRLSGSTIGTAFRTMIVRTTNASKSGEASDDDISKAETALRGIGVEVRKDATSFRDFNDILLDIYKNLDKMTDVDMSRIAYQVAGTRQTSIFRSAIKSYGEIIELQKEAENSDGISFKNQDIYMESLSAKMQTTTTYLQELWKNLIDTNVVKGAIDGLNGVLSVINQIVKTLGTIPTLAIGIGVALSFKGVFRSMFAEINAVAAAMSNVGVMTLPNYAGLGVAISGLTAQQAALVLSTRNLSAAELEEIVIKNGLIEKYGAEQLVKYGILQTDSGLLVSKKAVNAEELKGTLLQNASNKSKMESYLQTVLKTGANAGESGSEIVLSKALIDDMVIRKLLTVEKGKEILSSAGIVSGDVAETVSKKYLTTATLSLAKAKITALAASHPLITAIGILGIAIFGAVKANDHFTESLKETKERLSNVQEESETTKGKINSLNTELNDVRQNIKDINSLNGAKVTKDGELTVLKEQESSLEYQIVLLKEKQRLQDKEATEAAEKVLNAKTQSELVPYVKVNKIFADKATGYRERFFSGPSYLDTVGDFVSGKTNIPNTSTESDQLNEATAEMKMQQRTIDELIVKKDELRKNNGEESESYRDVLTNIDKATKARDYASEVALKHSDVINQCLPSLDQESETYRRNKAAVDDYVTSISKAVPQVEDLATDLSATPATGVESWTEDQIKKLDEYKSKFETIKNAISSMDKGTNTKTDVLDMISELGLSSSKSTSSVEGLRSELQKASSLNFENIQVLLTSMLGTNLNQEDYESLIKVFSDISDEIFNVADTLKLFSTEDFSLQGIVSEMEKLKDCLDTVGQAYAKFKDNDDKNQQIGVDDLSGIQEKLGSLAGYDDFVQIVTRSGVSAAEVQKAFNNLTTEYIYHSRILDGVTEDTKDLYINLLKEQGIVNAAEIVNNKLSGSFGTLGEAMQLAIRYGIDLQNVTWGEINALINEGKVTADTAKQLAYFALKKQVSNGIALKTSGDIQNLVDLAKTAGIASDLLSQYAAIKKATETTPHLYSMKQAELKALEQKISGMLSKGDAPNSNYTPVNYNGGLPSEKIKGGGGDKTKETAKSIDWVEQAIKNLERSLSDLHNELDNTDGWLKQLKIQDEIRSKTKDVAKAYKEAVKAYKKQYDTQLNFLGKDKTRYKGLIESNSPIDDFKKLNNETYDKVVAAQEAWKTYQEIYSTYKEQVYKIESENIKYTQLEIDMYKEQEESLKSKLDNTIGYKQQNKILDVILTKEKKIYDLEKSIAKTKDEKNRLEEEHKKLLADTAKQQFDNIQNEYSNKTNLNAGKQSLIQSDIDTITEQGYVTGTSAYKKLAELDNAELERQQQLRQKLIQKFKDDITAKNITQYDDQWYEQSGVIYDVAQNIKELEKNTLAYGNSLRQLDWDAFDRLMGKFDGLTSESKFLIDIMNSDKKFDKNGEITNSGTATIGQHALNYDTYFAQAEEAKRQLKELDTNSKDQKVIEERNKILELQQQSILAAIQEKEAIISLVKEGIEAEISAMEESISKKKEVLDAEKSLHDYQKSINDQKKEMVRVEKQLNALEGDDSDSAKSKKRELLDQLSKLKDQLSETEYNKSVENQQKNLDDILEKYKKDQESYMEDTEKLFNDAFDRVNSNSEQIGQIISGIAKEVGYNVSTNITNAWGKAGNAVSKYSETFTSRSVSILSVINQIKSAWETATKAYENYTSITVKDTVADYVGSTNVKGYSNVKQILGSNTASKNTTGKSQLNQYVTSKGYKQLTFDNMINIAKAFGINGISTRKDVEGEDGLPVQNREKILNALKNAGFNHGGKISFGEVIRNNGDDVLMTGKIGEEVLTESKITTLSDSAKMMDKIFKENPIIPSMNNFIRPHLNIPNFAGLNQINKNVPITINPVVNLTLDCPNISDTNSLAKGLKDPRIQDIVYHAAWDQALGKGKLNINRY